MLCVCRVIDVFDTDTEGEDGVRDEDPITYSTSRRVIVSAHIL